MVPKIVIHGRKNQPDLVIKYLEKLGGNNKHYLVGDDTVGFYWIDDLKRIKCTSNIPEGYQFIDNWCKRDDNPIETKYILVHWPESQNFIGMKNCYHINSIENLDLDQAIFVPKEIFDETFNITTTSEYIEDKLNDIKQVIRQSVSKLLINTSEKQPLECEIVIESIESIGLSSVLLPRINKIWQECSEGWIRFKYEDNNIIHEFDSLELDIMLQILKGLENENSNTRTSN